MASKLRSRLVLSSVVFFTLIYVLIVSVFPLEWSELQQRLELWRNGVRIEKLGALEVFHRNGCSASADCTCVLLVHGLGDQAQTWRKLLLQPSVDWYRPVHLFAVNLPGSGKSDAPTPQAASEVYRTRNMAKTLSTFVDQTPQCSSWMAVGNSLGGQIVAWMGIEGTPKVKKLVLVDASGLKEATRDLKGASFAEGSVEALKEFQRRAYFRPRHLPEKIWRAAASRMKSSNAREVMNAQTEQDFLDSSLQSIKRPTMIFWGAADGIISKEIGRKMATLIPGSAYREAPECGHLPQKECPLALLTALNEMLRFGTM